MAAVGVKGKAAVKASKKSADKKSRGKEPAVSAKAKPKKAPKKAPSKKETGKNEEKSDPVIQRRIRGSDTVVQGEAVKAVVEVDPFEVARQTMKGSVPAIVEAMVELAKQGSCSHAKTLLEMTGAKHMFDGDAAEQEGGESWAKLVLERLDEAEIAAGQESASLHDG